MGRRDEDRDRRASTRAASGIRAAGPTRRSRSHARGRRTGRAIAPAGASRGSREAVDLRDGGDALRRLRRECRRSRTSTARSRTRSPASMPCDQAAVDATLIALDGTPNKARLGGNATVAVSLAVAHAAAAARGVPLWRYLAGGAPVSLPLPEIQIFGGGAHAGRRIDLQDLMVMPVGATIVCRRARDGRRDLSRGGRADGRRRQARRRRRRRRLLAGVRHQRGGAGHAGARDRARGLRARTRRRDRRSTSPPPNSDATAAIALALEQRTLDRDEHDRSCCSTGSTAIRSCRSRIRSPRTTATAGSRSRAPRARACRSSATTT